MKYIKLVRLNLDRNNSERITLTPSAQFLPAFPAIPARARVNRETDGFVKILSCAASDKILGAHIIGSDAGNMIAELTLAVEKGLTAEDIAYCSHAHPTETEAVREAAMATDGRAVHM